MDDREKDERLESVGQAWTPTTIPTADRVHASLARLGLLSKACHPGSSVRYDRRTDRHHHLVCLSCDRVIDIQDARLDALPVPDTRRHGFAVSDVRVQLRGICRECLCGLEHS